MDDELRNAGGAGEMVMGGDRPSQRNVLRGTKRSAATVPSAGRKQLLVSGLSSTSLRGSSGTAIVTQSRANESSDGLTYQLVQIASPESGLRQHNVTQRPSAHIIASNGQELMMNGGHSIVLNSAGGLTVSAAPVQDAPAQRVAYVPAGAISVTASPTVNQPIQLQSFDGGGSQYYIMLPSGSEIIQTASSAPIATASATASPARVIAAPRLQQAAFIPLSRLEPVQTATLSNVQPASGVAAHMVKQLDFHVGGEQAGGTKEIKRRVSHNEVEKRRRDKINSWISKLSRVVPNSSVDFSNAKLPQSKGGVLAKTVDYIQELRESNEQLVDTVRQYDSLLKCVQEENKQLRDIMQQAGIEAPPPISSDVAASADMLLAIEDVRSVSAQPANTATSVPTATMSGTTSVSSSVVSMCNADSSTSSASISGLAKGSTLVLMHTNKVNFVQNMAQADNNAASQHDGSEDGRDEEDTSVDE